MNAQGSTRVATKTPWLPGQFNDKLPGYTACLTTEDTEGMETTESLISSVVSLPSVSSVSK